MSASREAPRVRRRALRPSGKLLAEDARRHHRSLILQQLFSAGPASRADLARATGLTRVTVSDLVAELLEDGLVAELGAPVEVRVGKPPTLVGLVAGATHVLALDLSPHDRMVGGVVDLAGQVRARAELPREGVTGEDAVELVLQLAGELAAATDRPILGIGIGSMGIVDPHGLVVDAPNLGWAGVDLASRVGTAFGVPVHVANDANTAALGEHTFGDTAASDLLVLSIGAGVGAGLVVGGALVRGHRFAAGEIGHVTVEESTDRCACGRTGCLETVVAVPHLRASTRTPAEVGAIVGRVLAPVVGTLDLAEVVLAGPRDLLDGDLRDAVSAALRARVLDVNADGLVVRTSRLGDDIVIAGATVLVLSGELGVS